MVVATSMAGTQIHTNNSSPDPTKDLQIGIGASGGSSAELGGCQRGAFFAARPPRSLHPREIHGARFLHCTSCATKIAVEKVFHIVAFVVAVCCDVCDVLMLDCDGRGKT